MQTKLLPLTLACALAGCQPAHFDGNPTAAAPVTTTAAAPPAATVTGTPAPVANLATFAGQAAVAGKPVADATVSLTDAITGKALKVVASGGGNLKTDAQGNFSVQVAGLAASQMVNLKVAGARQTVSGLIRGSGAALGGKAAKSYRAGYQLQDLSISLEINEVSTAVLQAYLPLFQLLSDLTGNDLVSAVNSLSDSAEGLSQQLAVTLASAPDLAASLCSSAASAASQTSAIRDLVTRAGVASSLTSSVAQLARISTAFAAALSSSPNSGNLAIAISIGPNGQLSIGGTLVDLANGSHQDPPPNNNNNNNDGGSSPGGGDVDIVGACDASISLADDSYTGAALFKPAVTVTNTLGNLHIEVTQEDGEDDIDSITATVPTADVTFTSASSLGTLTTTDLGLNLADPAQAAKATKTLGITGAGTADSWVGHVTAAGGAVEIGLVSVSVDHGGDTRLSLSGLYPVSKMLGGRKVNTGHTTTFEAGSGVFELLSCSKAKITITSTSGRKATLERALRSGQ